MIFLTGLVVAAALASSRAAQLPGESALEDRLSAVAAQAGLPSPAADKEGQAVPPIPASKTIETSPSAGADRLPAGSRPLFLANGDFEGMPPFDTGLVAMQCSNLAPWGEAGWGLNAATFLRADDSHALEGVRLRVFHDGNSQVAGIFAKEGRGIKMGFARFVQGDAWGGTSCPGAGAIGWRKPEPLAVSGRRLALKIDVKNEEVRKFSNRLLRGGVGGTSHVMMAFNVWLSSPRLSKRAVLDLAVVHDCNWGVGKCGPNTGEDPSAYHYIVHVSKDDRDSPRGSWMRWIIDLSGHIQKAADRFGWDPAVRASLSITQVEFLIEVMDVQGSVLFDNVYLVEVPGNVAIHDTAIPRGGGADPLPVTPYRPAGP